MLPAIRKLLLALALCASACVRAEGDTIEVLHWWTSGAEQAALREVIDGLKQRGHQWRDASVSGGDDRMRLVAGARARAGREPDALMLQGRSLRGGQWVSLQKLAQDERWDAAVPQELARHAKVDGVWMAAPLNLHRTNWLWADRRIFDELKLQPPRSFEAFLAVARRIRAAGYLPLAHGREPWQDAMLFDNAVLSAGGAAFYRAALLELRPEALRGPAMVRAFEQLAALRELIDPQAGGRPWNFATAMVARHRAAMQVMGDWAKGELSLSGARAGEDYLCFPYPGTEGSFVYVIDLFAMPVTQPGQRAGQLALASTLLDAGVQARFSRVKGALPARSDIPIENFDSCGRRAALDLRQARRDRTLLPRYAAEVPADVRDAIAGAAAAFLDSRQTAAEGAAAMARAVAVALTPRMAAAHTR